MWAGVIRTARYRRRAIEALWHALNNMSAVNTVDPQEDARALGVALRRAIPVGEHARLKTDLTTIDRILPRVRYARAGRTDHRDIRGTADSASGEKTR